MISLLQQLVSINSVSGNEEEICIFLENYLKEIGFQVRRQYIDNKRFNLLAKRGKAKKYLLFHAHLDTVKPAKNWKEPFKLKTSGDRLIGLGAYDMKGGVAIILKVLEESEDPVKVAFLVDEENEQLGAKKLLYSSFLKDVEESITTEVGVGNVKEEMLGIGRRGSIAYQVEAYMEEGHFALTKNSILQYLCRLKDEETDVLNLFYPQEEYKKGGICKFDIIENFFGKEKLSRKIKTLAKKSRINIKRMKKLWFFPSYKIGKTKIRKIGRKLGIKECIGMSEADENIFAKKIKPHFLVPVGGGEHSRYEWISKKSMERCVVLLKKVLSEYYEI